MWNIWMISLCTFYIYNIQITKAADCNANEKFGKDNPDTQSTLVLTDTYYLSCGYKITCCGVLNEWYYDPDVTSVEVELHVWRPTTGNNYRLISTTKHTAAATTKQTVVPDTFLAKDGDCLGWRSAGVDVIGYKNGGTGINAKYLSAGSVNPAGDVIWGGTTSSQEWAIGARLGEPSDPVYTGDTTASIVDTASVNDLVTITISFTDDDNLDQLSLSASNDYFVLSDNGDNTASLKVKQTLEDLSGKDETLTVIAKDLCDHTVTQDIVISVINTVPVLTGLASSVDTLEDVAAERQLTKFTCTDSAALTLSVSATPVHTPPYFHIKETGAAANEYGLYARSQTDATQGQFDYTTQRSYTLEVSCDDGEDITTSTITVNLIQNAPPVITNIPADGILIDVSALEVNGKIVFTVDFYDENNDTMNVHFICEPSNCPFEVLDSGEVIVSDDITTYPDTGYNIFIGVTDHKNFGINRTLSVRITDRNTPPRFLNLDNIETVDEGTAAGTSIFEVSATDDDGDMYTFSWTHPTGGASFFDLDHSSGIVTTSRLIDYEEISTIAPLEFDVLVSDGIDTSTATLTLSVIDANENMNLSSSIYRIDVLEWTAVDTILEIPGFMIIDDDTSDTYTCTIDCGAIYDGYYHILSGCNKTYAALSVASLYKLDDGQPTSITCSLTVEEAAGNSDTASLIIAVLYDNNFTPVFSTNLYDFEVDPDAESNTDINTVTATDGDAEYFGNISYSLDLTGFPDPYFKIDGLTGVVKTLKPMSACNCDDQTFIIPVLATDDGGRTGTSTIQITVTDTNIVPDRFKTFWDDERNPVWFSILILLIAATTVVTIYVCFNYVFMTSCCNTPCLAQMRRFDWRPNSVRASSPPSPRPRRRNNSPNLVSVRKPPTNRHGWQDDSYFF